MFSFENISKSLSQFSDVLTNDFYGYRNEVYCKKCGTSMSDFIDTGFVGCADCYSYFRDAAIELAADVHGRTNHIGKVPTAQSAKAAKTRELERMIAEKEKAVRREDYAYAAELKEKIEKLRRELK